MAECACGKTDNEVYTDEESSAEDKIGADGTEEQYDNDFDLLILHGEYAHQSRDVQELFQLSVSLVALLLIVCPPSQDHLCAFKDSSRQQNAAMTILYSFCLLPHANYHFFLSLELT